MKLSIKKTNVVQILLIIVIILLALNIVLEKYYHPAPSFKPKDLPALIINEKFLSSLNNYNMDSSWITRKNISSNNEDSLKFNYIVDVPPDLPVSLLLREIQNQFDTNEVNISTTEFKSAKSTELKISSGDNLKLKAILRYNSSVNRGTDTIGFILTGIEDLSSDDLKNLLLLPEHFAAILIPSKRSQELLKTLKENQKETAVLLNDDISELEFKLSAGYSDRRIKNSVVSIIRKFYDASLFIIDENSDIYNSEHYKMIRNEFSKRNIQLATEKYFSKLGSTSPENVITAIKSNQNPKRLFLVSAEDFLEMPPLLEGLRKIGYKFFNPSELIKR